MKILLKILFAIFFICIAVGIYFVNTTKENAEVIMGLCILYFSFICMPLFIYYRYKDGKYKKYILNDEKIRKAFKQQDKD